MTAAETAGKCDIKYVYMEMVLNKDTKYDVLSGLFKGIIEKKGQQFILLQGLDKTTNALNRKFYNIMTLEVREGDYKNFTYLTCEQVDQDNGFEMLEQTYQKLLDAGFGIVNDPKIIDIDKYTDVPEEYKVGRPVGTGTAQSGAASGVGSFAAPHTRYNQGTTYAKQTTVKPDPAPGLIARTKTKKPTKALLDTMFEKVQQITAGNFEPAIPEIMGEDAAGVSAADDNDYYDQFGAGYCC